MRTLHFYDRIGLLVPSAREENGYRLYGDADLERLELALAAIDEAERALADASDDERRGSASPKSAAQRPKRPWRPGSAPGPT